MDQTDIRTPNPCVLTPEEQFALLAILKKTIIRLGINSLPTAPVNNPYISIPNGGSIGNILISNGFVFKPSTSTWPEPINGTNTVLMATGPNQVNEISLGANLTPSPLDTIQAIQTTSRPQFAGLGVGISGISSSYLRMGNPVRLNIDNTGKPIISNNVQLAGQGYELIVAVGSQIGQTGAVTSVTQFTTAAAGGSFEIGGYIDVTAFTAGTISMTCAYTDPSGNAQILTIPLVALAGTIGTTVGSLTDAQALIVSIQTSGANTIKIATTVTAFTGTYNVYGWIKQVN